MRLVAQERYGPSRGAGLRRVAIIGSKAPPATDLQPGSANLNGHHTLGAILSDDGKMNSEAVGESRRFGVKDSVFIGGEKASSPRDVRCRSTFAQL